MVNLFLSFLRWSFSTTDVTILIETFRRSSSIWFMKVVWLNHCLVRNIFACKTICDSSTKMHSLVLKILCSDFWRVSLKVFHYLCILIFFMTFSLAQFCLLCNVIKLCVRLRVVNEYFENEHNKMQETRIGQYFYTEFVLTYFSLTKEHVTFFDPKLL